MTFLNRNIESQFQEIIDATESHLQPNIETVVKYIILTKKVYVPEC